MRVELKDIKGGVLKQEYSLPLADFPELIVLAETGHGTYLEPLRFTLRLQQSGRMIEVDGRFQAQARLECGRCLTPYVEEVDEIFSFTFTPQSPSTETEGELELVEDDLGLIGYQDDVLELQAPLQDQAIMALPVAQVCRSQCQGLCLECGQNLNEKRCQCVSKPFNNKFGELADLIDKNN